MGIVFANFAAARLAQDITAEATAIPVENAGALPTLGQDAYFYAVLVGAEAQREVVRVTGIAGKTLTVTRAQDQSVPRSYRAGDVIECRLTRIALADWTKEIIAETSLETEAMLSVSEPDILAVCKSDIADQFNKAIPLGAVFCSLSTTPEDHFSVLDGGVLVRLECADLFALWGETFGAGDGSTTFRKPDARGRFLRFCDLGAGIDPDAAARTSRGDGTGGDVPGSLQNDAVRSHNHTVDLGFQWIAEGGAWAWGDREHGEGLNTVVMQLYGGTETRAANIAMVPVVRIKNVEIS